MLNFNPILVLFKQCETGATVLTNTTFQSYISLIQASLYTYLSNIIIFQSYISLIQARWIIKVKNFILRNFNPILVLFKLGMVNVALILVVEFQSYISLIQAANDDVYDLSLNQNFNPILVLFKLVRVKPQ